MTIVLLLASGIGVAAPALDTAGQRAAVGTVTVRTLGDTLNERSGPSTWYAVHGTYRNGAQLGVLCQTWGQQQTGTVSNSAWWLVDTRGWYISEAFVAWDAGRPAVPWCNAARRPASATVRVTSGSTLSIRTGPDTTQPQTAVLPNGGPVTVACRMWGQPINGRVDNTPVWDKLTGGGYVADAFVAWTKAPVIPWCGESPQSVPPASRPEFIAESVPGARQGQARFQVPASVTIAQAILESGAGASTLTRMDHNVFGMKCFGNPGSIAIGCRSYGTFECAPGCYNTHATFRAYTNIADSYLDHGQMLATLARYKPCFTYTHDPDHFAHALQTAGYATDPHYARNLIHLMQQYNLYQYDN